MKIVVKEIFNHPLATSGKDKIYKHIITADTFEECCVKIYELERGSRYNNFVRYDFMDLDVKKAYHEWKKDGVTIDLYYGGGVVD